MNGLEKKIAAELAAANALEEKYNDQPRSGWVKPGSRARSNQAISVSRQEVVALARDHHAALVCKHQAQYQVIMLQRHMQQYAETSQDAITCPSCRKAYLMEWLQGECPYCRAEKESWELLDKSYEQSSATPRV